MITTTIAQLKYGLAENWLYEKMFYDWFCTNSSLRNRGKRATDRLRALVLKCPEKFDDTDTIDIKNCLPACCNTTYDCIRVWDKNDEFKYAFVPNDSNNHCSSVLDKNHIEHTFDNWTELKKWFAAK